MSSTAYWFDDQPDEVSSEELAETIYTDIVILGCGLAGAVAALSAGETGAAVMVFEKAVAHNARGRGNFAFNCRLRPALGDQIADPTPLEIAQRRNAIVKEIMEFGGYRGDQRVANFLVDNAGKVYDWIIDIAESMGVEIEVRKDDGTSQKEGVYQELVSLSGNRQFHYDIIFQPEGQKTLLEMLITRIAVLDNIEIRYETPGLQLILDPEPGIGVTGVIIKERDELKRVNCRGVILCTGGYEWDAEMMEKFGGMGIYTASVSYENEFNTGDGQKMGMWVGAKMDEAPNCMLFEDAGGYHLYTDKLYGIGVCRKPWLAVNIHGERMDNEDKVWPMLGGSDIYKPGHMKFAIWDDMWRDEAKVEKMGSAHSYFSEFHGYTPELTEEKIASGDILSAETLDNLARKMGIDPEKLRQTVERYNWCCEQGYDYDFGKPGVFLKPVAKPPFYAAKMGAALLVTLGGLKINTRMQVLDHAYLPIPCLYAAGNVSGSLFFNDYPENIPGLTHARAATFGYFAAKNAVADTLRTHNSYQG
jgi:fumarate reductase flavoprotein subunit